VEGLWGTHAKLLYCDCMLTSAWYRCGALGQASRISFRRISPTLRSASAFVASSAAFAPASRPVYVIVRGCVPTRVRLSRRDRWRNRRRDREGAEGGRDTPVKRREHLSNLRIIGRHVRFSVRSACCRGCRALGSDKDTRHAHMTCTWTCAQIPQVYLPLSIYCLSACLSACLSVCLSVSYAGHRHLNEHRHYADTNTRASRGLSIYLPICLSSYLSIF